MASNLAVATTMWPRSIISSERSRLQARENELVQNERCFGAFINRGATLFRHSDEGRPEASARKIIAHLIRQSDLRTQEILRLQREIIDEKKTVGDTEAGIVIAQDLYKLREKCNRQLQQLEGEMRRLTNSDAAHSSELRELRAEIERKLAESEDKKQMLLKTIKQLHDEKQRYWEDKISDLTQDLKDQLVEKEEELKDMEDSLRKLRQERADRSARRSGNSQENRPLDHTGVDEEQQAVVDKARKEVVATRNTYQTLQSQKGNIINGTTNGIAAGLMSGTIAAGTSPLLIPGTRVLIRLTCSGRRRPSVYNSVVALWSFQLSLSFHR
ncbi:hypothetical protein IL306_001628 [Fusarium sp. DS 682]|nr:hypothetical protein IL306_001628 [Fusarium sp. DS 682]